MSMLKRLKSLLTGEKEPEKKEESEKAGSTEKSESEVKEQVKETPEVTEKTDKPQETKETPTKTKSEKIKEKTIKMEKSEKVEEVPVKTDKPKEKVAKISEEPAKEEDESETEEKASEEVEESVEEIEEAKKKRSEKMTLLDGREVEVITRENVDKDFKQEVMDAGAESLALCFQCGTCTGACPSGRRTPYRIRQIVRKSVMGLKDEVISDDTLWMCTTCYECQERCPRAIKIVDIVKIARNYAAQAGYMGPAHKMVGSFVLKTGHGVPINPETQELRKKVGLGELPPTTHSFPGALEEVQTITKTTGFDKLIGYNWEKGELE